MKRATTLILGFSLAAALVGCSTAPPVADTHPLLPSITHSQPSDWRPFATSGDYTLSFQRSSYRVKVKDNGNEDLSAIVRWNDHRTGTARFERWHVSRHDCVLGHGMLVNTTLYGAFKHQTPFVNDGGTLASDAADWLCRWGRPNGKASRTQQP